MVSIFVFVALIIGDIAWYFVAVSWGENPLMYDASSSWYDASNNLNTVLFLAYSATVLVSFGYVLGRRSKRVEKEPEAPDPRDLRKKPRGLR